MTNAKVFFIEMKTRTVELKVRTEFRVQIKQSYVSMFVSAANKGCDRQKVTVIQLHKLAAIRLLEQFSFFRLNMFLCIWYFFDQILA